MPRLRIFYVWDNQNIPFSATSREMGSPFIFWGTQKPSQRGRCRRMSAEEGMRRELAVEEPTETAGNLALYASSVSASAATFPMGEGLDRLILNDTTITTALEWLRKSFNHSGHRSTQRQGDKRQRRSRLNRVTRTVARWYNQSTSGLLST